MRKFDKSKIILIVIWMITVFIFSAQDGTKSSNTSTQVTTTIVQILTGKNINENNPLLGNIETLIRKLAHYTIYTIGGFLIMNYTYTINITKNKKILYSIVFGGIYAITDEIHQLFVPGRSGMIFDVAIDVLGVITGVAIYIVLRKFIGKIKQK